MSSISQLGLGTAALGRPQYINLRQEKVQTSDLETFRQNGFQVLEKAYQSGIRYFDTAPGYGMAEGLLFEWLQSKNDASIQVATKWGYTYVANFDPDAKIHEIKEHSLTKLNEQWETSKAFATHLKVYQIHSATLETGVLENDAILNRLASLKNEHDIKIGISTTGANQVEVIKKAMEVRIDGRSLFDAFQVTYNILDQSLMGVLERLLPEERSIIVKEAMANGRLFRNKNYSHYDGLYDLMETLARKYNVGVDAIALNFCLRNIPHGVVLSGASNSDQIIDNMKAITFELDDLEIDKLINYKVDETHYWKERKRLAWS